MRITLLFCLLAATAHAQTNREVSIEPSPDPAADAQHWSEYTQACHDTAHLVYQSAGQWIDYLTSQGADDQGNAPDWSYGYIEPTIGEQWLAWESEGVEIPQWCWDGLAELTVLAPANHAIALGPPPLGGNTWVDLLIADFEKSLGDLELAWDYETDSIIGHYMIACNGGDTADGYIATAHEADLVENAAAADAEELDDLAYLVWMLSFGY